MDFKEFIVLLSVLRTCHPVIAEGVSSTAPELKFFTVTLSNMLANLLAQDDNNSDRTG